MVKDVHERFKETCDALGFDVEGPEAAGKLPGAVAAASVPGDSQVGRLFHLLERWVAGLG